MALASRLLAHRRALVLAFAAAAGAVTLALGGGTSLDEFLHAARAGFRLHPASGEVHIVEIDERSIAAIARWPWPRRIHGAAVDRLHAAGVRSIAFDVDFSSPSDPIEDARFAAALGRAGRTVILSTFTQQAGAGSERAIEAQPIPSLAANAFLAAANVKPDRDGQLRMMPYGIDLLGAPRPSLASMLAERPGAAGASFPIDTGVDPASIPRHSLIDLLQGRVPPAALAGKRIIIGATAVELGDRFAVPRHGVLPGVVAQAMAAETLLAGTPATERSGGWALLLALLVVAGAALPRGSRALRSILFVAAAACVLLLLPSLEAWFGLLPLGPAAAALLAGAAAGAIAGLALRHAETRLEDPETGLPNLLALERAAAGTPRLTIGVAHLANLPALVSADGDAAPALMRMLADRLRFAAGAGRVYRADEASLAWIAASETPAADQLQAISAVLRAPLARHAGELRLHCGAAEGSGLEARRLAAHAGLAASSAAAAGDPFRLFTAADGEAVARGVALLADFTRHAEQGRVWIAYQPKLDLRLGRVTAVEALVRWDHPRFGTLAPDAFVPVLEENGRAGELAFHVLNRALADAAAWEAGGTILDVAVNVSASLLHDEAATASLIELIRGSGVAPGRFTLEVTETAAMADPVRAVAALEAWRTLGLGVSIDDYGTGQSSLSYLQRLPATELKIDRSFVATIATEPRNAIMVRSTIAMAHELGLEVVAEGVEDQACLSLLREMGCDLAQGWLIARAMPAAAVSTFQPAFEPAPASTGLARRAAQAG